MAVLALQPRETRRPIFCVPAIRTPEKFEEARQFVINELAEISLNDLSVDDMRTLRTVEAVKEAMDASPFLYKDGAILPKGFTPRIIH